MLAMLPAFVALAAPLALALPAAAPIARFTPEQLDAQLEALQRSPAIGDRIEAVSKLFLGTPYVEFPLGEGGSGPEPQARFRLDGVDCQTFVETVLALSNARSLAHAQAILDDVRYGAQPPSFAHRSHFTEAQWLPMLVSKGYLRDEVPALDGRAPAADLVLERAHWSRVPMLKRLLEADIPEGRFPVRYLRAADLKKREKSVEPGSVILVVRDQDPTKVVRVSHMGLLIPCSQGVCVRHASSTERKVVEEGLDSYLDRMKKNTKWPVQGYGLYAPSDAKVRAAQMLPR